MGAVVGGTIGAIVDVILAMIIIILRHMLYTNKRQRGSYFNFNSRHVPIHFVSSSQTAAVSTTTSSSSQPVITQAQQAPELRLSTHHNQNKQIPRLHTINPLTLPSLQPLLLLTGFIQTTLLTTKKTMRNLTCPHHTNHLQLYPAAPSEPDVPPTAYPATAAAYPPPTTAAYPPPTTAAYPPPATASYPPPTVPPAVVPPTVAGQGN